MKLHGNRKKNMQLDILTIQQYQVTCVWFFGNLLKPKNETFWALLLFAMRLNVRAVNLTMCILVW